jgi:hypothetical protein
MNRFRCPHSFSNTYSRTGARRVGFSASRSAVIVLRSVLHNYFWKKRGLCEELMKVKLNRRERDSLLPLWQWPSNSAASWRRSPPECKQPVSLRIQEWSWAARSERVSGGRCGPAGDWPPRGLGFDFLKESLTKPCATKTARTPGL